MLPEDEGEGGRRRTMSTRTTTIDPGSAVDVLRMTHPFVSDKVGTKSALGAIRALQAAFEEEEMEDDDEPAEDDENKGRGGRRRRYRVDTGTLDHLAQAASYLKQPDLALTVWDVAEGSAVGSRGTSMSTSMTSASIVTEGMYEGVITAFFRDFRLKQDDVGFAVLGDMERRGGYAPSRSLIRELGNFIR